MRNRAAPAQSLHDRVIQVVEAAQSDYDAYTNPGQEHNWSVTIDGEDLYPDLILCRNRTKSIVHLIEVETAGSVTDVECFQWATYARGPGTLWLLVPSSHLATARDICRRKGIAASFGKWWLENGGIRFEWLKAVAAAR